jgi:hypothetical protein
MSWVIWRQHRAQAAWVLLLVAALCGLMLWVRARATADVVDLRAAGCLLGDISGTGCQAPLDDFAVRYNFTIPAFELGVPLVLAVTAALVGAPLIAREVEQRTQLVAWTQSVTRQRWYRGKVVTVSAGLSLAGLIAGAGTYLLQGPLSDGGVTSSRWPWFFSTALAPAGSTALAFALAVAAGAWLRRPLPAVALALVGFLALFAAAGRAVQTLTPVHHTLPGDRGVPRDAWTWPTGTADAIPYHPANQFWPLQFTFLTILLALTVAVLVLGWHATRTRAV